MKGKGSGGKKRIYVFETANIAITTSGRFS